MSEVRPLEVQDLFLALAACPMTAQVWVGVPDCDAQSPVLSLDPYAGPGVRLEMGPVYDPDDDQPAAVILKKIRAAVKAFKRGSLYVDKTTGAVHMVTQSEVRDFAAKLDHILAIDESGK